MTASIDSGRTFYITGGTLPADATSCVERQSDRDLVSAPNSDRTRQYRPIQLPLGLKEIRASLYNVHLPGKAWRKA